jgi:plastocyanin
MKRLIYLIPLWAMIVFLFVPVALAQSTPEQVTPTQDTTPAQVTPTQYGADQGAAPAQDAPQNIDQRTESVNIEPSGFLPAHKNIPPGTTISWFNADSHPHTVTADDGSFDSGNIKAGETFTFTFDQGPGTWSYHSTVDPSWGGGNIKVTDSNGGGSNAPADFTNPTGQ